MFFHLFNSLITSELTLALRKPWEGIKERQVFLKPILSDKIGFKKTFIRYYASRGFLKTSVK